MNVRQAMFDDKIIVCVDCESTFVFTKGERYFFASKGLAEPKRCPECRLRRKLTLVPKGVNYKAA